GELFSENGSRARRVLRLNALLKGFSGIRPVVLNLLTTLLNKQIHAAIPQQGSLDASGDLAPLAHLALVLIGEGKVHGPSGELLDTKPIFDKYHIEPITLQAKEGLALITGTQAMVAVGVIN